MDKCLPFPVSQEELGLELVEIYDAQGRPTGAVRPRGQPLKEGEYLLAVGVWIVDRDNNILLTKRSMEKRWAPGKWENTAGHAQAGEDCPSAMVREIREEIGLTVSKERLVPLGRARTGCYLGENFGLRLEKRPQRLVFQDGETCDAKWVSPQELDEMAKRGELSPSVLSHMKGSYRAAFLKFIGCEGSTLLGKDEVP